MSREGCRFGGDAFHHVAVGHNRIRKMIDNRMFGTIVARGKIRFGNRHADAIRKTLTERTRRHIHTRRESVFGMPGRERIPLTKIFDFLQRQIITRQMQQGIQQHRAMSTGQNKTVTVKPFWIRGIVFEKTRPQHIRHRRRAERQTGMSAVGFLNRIHRKRADGVDGQLVEFRGG